MNTFLLNAQLFLDFPSSTFSFCLFFFLFSPPLLLYLFLFPYFLPFFPPLLKSLTICFEIIFHPRGGGFYNFFKNFFFFTFFLIPFSLFSSFFPSLFESPNFFFWILFPPRGGGDLELYTTLYFMYCVYQYRQDIFVLATFFIATVGIYIDTFKEDEGNNFSSNLRSLNNLMIWKQVNLFRILGREGFGSDCQQPLRLVLNHLLLILNLNLD